MITMKGIALWAAFWFMCTGHYVIVSVIVIMLACGLFDKD